MEAPHLLLKGRTMTRPKPVTFAFLADPQLNDPEDDDNPRVVNLSKLNQCLNSIDTSAWPSDLGLTADIVNKEIGPLDFLIFGGDLCQSGGSYNLLDQMAGYPQCYNGGWQLEMVRWLFENQYQPPITFGSKATRTKYDRVYFGLGNHDIQSEGTPGVGWYKAGTPISWSRPVDYWRYQMWNFICQMHTGVVGPSLLMPMSYAEISILNGSIDAADGSFEWPQYSYNYHLNFGGFSIFQLHLCGGDEGFGRKSGLQWFKDRLQTVGTAVPIIIVQHYPFDNLTVQPCWTEGEMNAFLGCLADYNIVALLTGHIHDQLETIPYPVQVPGTSPSVSFNAFRPGSCGVNSNFALVRMAPDSFNILMGSATSGQIQWQKGYGETAGNIAYWNLDEDWNSNYFPGTGGLSGIYADTNPVYCPPDRFIVGFSLRKKGGNRLAPQILCANPDGTDPQWIANDDWNSNYFPDTGGLSDIYADTNPVYCPPGRIITGFSLRKKGGNRLAPQIQCANPDGTDPHWVSNDDWNSNYFPQAGGLGSIYADTNELQVESDKDEIVTGISLRRKGGNRLAPQILVRQLS